MNNSPVYKHKQNHPVALTAYQALLLSIISSILGIGPHQKALAEDRAAGNRSTYESLTEDRGVFQLLNDRRSKSIAAAPEDKKARDAAASSQEVAAERPPSEGALINFNSVSITEVLKYVSRLTGKNFIYDPDELQFSITMISDSETSLQELMSMLIQNLQIHGFSLIEEGNGFIIHANPDIKGVNGLYSNRQGSFSPQIATKVFLLQNVEADRCAAIVKVMLSKDAIVEVVESSKIIVSDVAENIQKLDEILAQLDTQSNGLEIGQYVTVNLSPAMIASLAERIMAPLANNKALLFIPHVVSNSIFIVSTPYLIERSLAVMQTIDLNQAKSGLWDVNSRFNPNAAPPQKEGKGEEPAPSKRGIESMTRDELEQELRKRGFTQAQIDSLTDNEAKALLIDDIRSVEEAKVAALKRRQLYTDSDLPIGTVEATQFLIYKLQYRSCKEVATALKAISVSLSSANKGDAPSSLQKNDLPQSDLVITLHSLQAVEENNTLVFTGTRATIEKVKSLIAQVDLPVRQVFIEALVLDTTLTNSLQFGVEWAGEIERTNFGAQVGFIRPDNSTFGTAFNAVTQTLPNPIVPPVAGGLSAGAIGRKIKFQGKGFRSTGSLITALHSDKESHVMMNPKITTEHNIPAEIFVGAQVPIKGQSIANATSSATSSIVATNYETQQVGILLKVTPLISSQETVTLIIEQKISSANQAAVNAQGATTAPPATVQETRTTTRVHLPTDHFLILSGMIQEEKDYTKDNIPCLGGLPFVGSLFGVKKTDYGKRNIMIFIRPIILDVPQDIDEITKRQEAVLKAKSRVNQGWNKEMDDLIELLNL